METKNLIQEINKLPKAERILIIEKTLAAIRQEEIVSKMEEAANFLYPEYAGDKELTSFTALDGEGFYEPR